MVTCELYRKELSGDWDEFVRSSKSPLFIFERQFMDYHSDRYKDFSLLFWEDDSLIAILPANIIDDAIYSHGGLTFGGLILSHKIKAEKVIEVIERLKDFLKKKSIRKIEYKAVPYIFNTRPCQEDLYALSIAGGLLFRRDVSSVIDLAREQKFSKGRKWLIARAKKNNLLVENSTDWVSYHELLSSVLAKHNATPTHSAAEMALLHERFPENIRLKVVQNEGRMICGVLLFVYEGVMHTQYIAADELGRESGALDLTLAASIDEAKQSGFGYFSFGISTERGGLYLNTGLISQKESFGARAIVHDFYRLELND
ncbi:GNAT family N-acetyltransferase [Pseudomonas asplenii]|uniref:Acetyltransferase (GNAT) domain-containing protein n=1 Tax=Pseudomonas asplenii TaxID=53407 RepID=A0A1H6MF50_9PSED|nr:GNAT family N-acetyltransferase [Pseudomonas fuscovaginae]SEH97790.1 Acetyltransferase (GNAT) domain-containing protein [Pseudomonas fuscovaginae]